MDLFDLEIGDHVRLAESARCRAAHRDMAGSGKIPPNVPVNTGLLSMGAAHGGSYAVCGNGDGSRKGSAVPVEHRHPAQGTRLNR